MAWRRSSEADFVPSLGMKQPTSQLVVRSTVGRPNSGADGISFTQDPPSNLMHTRPQTKPFHCAAGLSEVDE